MFKNLAARVMAWLSIAALILAAAPSLALAQTYPSSNPTYVPTAVLPATTCAAACDVVFNVNGISTVSFRIAGAGTGIAAVIQGANDRSSSPTYSTLTVQGIGGIRQSTVTATGLYRVNTAGLASVRFHLTAVTGSVTIGGAGTLDAAENVALPARKATYSASIVALAPAASATDFLTLTGSASATVEVTHAECSGISTAAATATVEALLRSTADSAGTPSAMTAVPHDSTDPAAAGTVTAYTANPTTGSLVGIVRAGKLTTNTAATSAFVAAPLAWDFGSGENQTVVLRGATQVFALNGAGASFTAGSALNCAITWIEY